MNLLLSISAVIIGVMLIIAIFNLATLRVITSTDSSAIDDSISILIPMRNEAENISALMTSISAQIDLKDFEIIALNDGSTDTTSELLEGISLDNLQVIDGAPLVGTWLGKNYACYQLAKSARGKYLVFLDADVRVEPRAISESIRAMELWGWQFLSPYPRQIAITFLERLTQPLLQWSWFTSLPHRLTQRWPRPSTVVANGQFMIIRADAYRASGGHEKIKGEVLDDLELARVLIRAGFRGGVADGSRVAACRMYKSGTQLIEGYAKSQWRAFVNPFGAVIAVALLIFSSILPISFGLSGSLLGWYLYFAIVLTRILAGVKTRTTPSAALLHPISALIWIYLILLSWSKKRNGKLTWRGRSI